MNLLFLLFSSTLVTLAILLYLVINGLKPDYTYVSKKERIKLGVGLFPDTMPFFLAEEPAYNYFSAEQIDLEIKLIKEWETIFEKLDTDHDDAFDIIIGNRDICNEKNKSGQYAYLKDIHRYRGFSILAQTPRGKNKIETFAYYKSKQKHSVIESLKTTLNQISRENKFLIYASDSDHHKTLSKLISGVGFNIEDFHIININTERAFRRFIREKFMRWEGEKLSGKAFVGGITHRLCADWGSHYNGIYEIFSYYEDIIEKKIELKNTDGHSLDLTQFNGFVISSSNKKDPKFMEKIEKVYRCWNKIKREIERYPSHYVPQLINLLKTKISYYKNKLPELEGNEKLINKVLHEWEQYLEIS